MDQQNRLLAMLKSATTVPGPLSSSASPQGSINSNSTHSTSQTQPPPPSSQYLTAGNLGSAGSPREPSPTPPPPSLQAVTLLDLFKNISSPPPPTASSEGSNPDDQKNKLLGMLNSIGQATPNAGVISPSQGSNVGTPTTSGEKGDPLAVFKAGHPSHPPASPTGQGPIINHPSGITSPHVKPVQAQHTGTSTSSSQAKAKPAKTEDKPTSAATSNETPKKSIFHFDSPFDAFEQLPRSRQASTAKPATPKEVKVKLEEDHALNRVKSTEKLVSSGKGSPQGGEVPLQTTNNPYEPPATFTTPVSVNELPQAEIDDKLRNTCQVGKVVKDGQGKGPKALTSHTTIDLSQPNLDSLVNTGDPVHIAPTTKMRTDYMTFKKGKRVGITTAYMAYTMSKGRVRLIDSSSGARLVIQLLGTASFGPIVDLAVTSNYVATIGWDKTVVVHKVPVNGWKTDNPEVEMSFYCVAVNGPIGWPKKIEWVKKEGKDWLAVGGSEGVILLDPSAYPGGGRVVMMEDVCKQNRILKTEGDVVDFCLNQSHQAIGLLSSTSQCTLYNVSNLNRVWNRQLPSASSSSEPSSIQFCESNILVGRARNTHYDLIQITVDLAVLSTIKLTAPSPCLEELNYSHAVYDPIKTTLYIAPFARGSLYAFKYALKGQQPVKDVSKPDGPKVIAFDKVAEYPLEPVISLVLAKKGVEEDSEIFYATPTGFSQATITRSAYDALKAPLPKVQQPETNLPTSTAKAVPSPKSPKGSKIELPKPRSKASNKNTSPAVVKTELPSTSEDEVSTQPRPKVQPRKASVAPVEADGEESAGGAVTQEELNKTLKKVSDQFRSFLQTEDRLSNHLKQLLKNEIATLNVRFDALTGPDFAAEISARVERQIKGSLNNTIVQEIKKTVVPAAASTIQNEVRTVTSNQVPAAIYDALQSVPKELERSLAPVVQRTISNLVSNAIDKAVQEAIQHTLLPAMTQTSSNVIEQLSAEMRSEMLQIRKELSPPSKKGQLANDHLLKTMSTSIAELQKQVAVLTEHLKSGHSGSAPNGIIPALQPQPPSHQSSTFAPPPAHHQPPPPPPAAIPAEPSGPSPSQLEDTFLSALGAQTTASTLQLVVDHLALTDYCLPNQGKSPLSQAVLLTLLHRLAIVLSEIPSTHSMFQQVAGWERRTALLVDPKDQNIAGYISRVLSVVQGQLTTVLNNLQRYPDQNTQSHLVVIRGIMDIIGHKMNV
ncbi:hypothetical protein L486_01236 [Kwoniella mangroviensis CBS 10435]|uniref:Uncharacterized protein n=1 Tax=Kwoniella mangroviensis CBS 10435 TaxID=1331196 RepID=A0A1B9J1Q4_9TREE|nr:hypothetical protein L486_01236 [Kwoniella mangroviensis CBS 10435]